MTTIVITIEGGVVQGVAASHQATVVIADFDVDGTTEDIHYFGGDPAVVFQHAMLPTAEQDTWIAEVLESLK